MWKKTKMASCSSKPNNLTKEVRLPFTPIYGGTLSGSEHHPLLRPVSTKWSGVTYDWLGLVACALRVGSQPTVGSLTDGPPESYGVDKGQFCTNTTQVHKNDWSLHKHVLIITTGLFSSLPLSPIQRQDKTNFWHFQTVRSSWFSVEYFLVLKGFSKLFWRDTTFCMYYQTLCPLHILIFFWQQSWKSGINFILQLENLRLRSANFLSTYR